MKPRAAGCAVLLFALLPAACYTRGLDPPYPVAILAFDQGLLGVWEHHDPDKDDLIVKVERCKLAVRDGRVSPGTVSMRGADDPHAPETAEAYTITLGGDDETPIELNGYLFALEGQTYLGCQVAVSSFMSNLPIGGVLPLHFFVRIELDGESVVVWAPEHSVAWIPFGDWLDAPPEPPAGPPRLPDDETPLLLTNSIDRAIDVLRRPEAARLFDTEPVAFRRVVP